MVFVEFFEFYTYPSRFRRRPVTSRECPPSSFLALLEAILVDAYLQQFCQNVEVGFEDSALDNTLAGIDQRVKRRLISSELLSLQFGGQLLKPCGRISSPGKKALDAI